MTERIDQADNVREKARAEAEEGWPAGHEDQRVRDIRSGARDGFVAGASWQASRESDDRRRIERVRALVEGPHPAESGLDSFTLAYVAAVIDAEAG